METVAKNHSYVFFRCSFTTKFVSSIHVCHSHTKLIKYLDSDSDLGNRFEKIWIREVLDSFYP